MMKKALPAFVVLLIFAPTLRAESSEPRGYTVQVASMPEEEKARAEVNRLVRHQEAAYYIKATVQGKGLYYRVRVGRFTTQEAARAHAEALGRNKLINDFLITTFEGPGNIAATDVANQASKQTPKIAEGYKANQQASKANNRPAARDTAVVTVADARAANAVRNEEGRLSTFVDKPAGLSNDRPSVRSNVASYTPVVQSRSEQRIKLYVHATTSISFDNSISSLTVLDPATVMAEIKEGRTATITGLAQGESVIIASSGDHRRTFVVEVMARPRKTAEQIAAEATHRQRKDRISGSVTLHFSPSTGDSPSLFRQRFEYAQKMAGSRTLLLNGDVFNNFGRAAGGLSPLVPKFGMERVSLGISAPAGMLNMLDSQLDISPLSLYGYTLRGLHLASDKGSRLDGLEIFGGIARPSPLSFIGSEGYVAGGIAPIAHGSSWRLRAGV
ncbi:MAG TPA: SPOR domain-containing protein, partial [Blastocatellia bacterium]